MTLNSRSLCLHMSMLRLQMCTSQLASFLSNILWAFSDNSSNTKDTVGVSRVMSFSWDLAWPFPSPIAYLQAHSFGLYLQKALRMARFALSFSVFALAP